MHRHTPNSVSYLLTTAHPTVQAKYAMNTQKKDRRITVIHQENVGATRARARGVEEATDCDWITFVDSDDRIATNYLGDLYNAVSDDIDIVTNEENICKASLCKEKYLEHLFIGGVNTGPWSKLFRRKLFNAHTFNIPHTIVVGEEVLMDIKLTFASDKEKIAVIPPRHILLQTD